jgi:Predicted hydrolases or acyltransferases (alpha/beta hydrolase superfamily)
MKKVYKVIGVILLLIIGILLIGLIVLAVNSPGKLEMLKDSEGKEIVGSLAEKNFIEIGGIRQGFFIRAENPENPVVLFLHGGPGSPELPLLIPYEVSERLEKHFTVCYWDQRGAGMSFSNSIDPATMTTEQMVEDTRQMTEYLQHRFNQEKIYLIGHSWGSYLGVKTIEKYPENYIAYIGIGQVTNQVKSEKLAYDYMLQHATEINDKSSVKNMKKFDKNAPDFPSIDYLGTVRGPLMNKYGIGFTHKNTPSMIGMMKMILFFKGYTLSEKTGCLRGMMFSLKTLWNDVIEDNLFESSVTFQVPVYITHGKYDYQVSHTLASEWFEKIEAPQKAFYTFEKSAHGTIMEEPEKFVQIIRNIALKNTENFTSDEN